jgi:hypothetical protein
MNVPESIKNSTEINNGEIKISVGQFIVDNFINTEDNKDRLHTDTILVHKTVILILINLKKEVFSISIILVNKLLFFYEMYIKK